jgi:acyl carrier protein
MNPFVERRIRGILADHLGVDAEDLTPETSLRDDLAVDGADIADLAAALEETWGISIPLRQLDAAILVSDLYALVDRLLATQPLEVSPSEASVTASGARYVAEITRGDGSDLRAVDGHVTPYDVEGIAEAVRDMVNGHDAIHVTLRVEGAGPHAARALLAAVRARLRTLEHRGVAVDVTGTRANRGTRRAS